MTFAVPIRNAFLNLERCVYTRLRARVDRSSTTAPHSITGQRGEDAAFFHLRALGYTIVARRWRSNRLAGDLDLVAWDGDTLVVFEIKTRTARDLMPAETQVDAVKQQMLRRMAASYLHQLPAAHRDAAPLRFDILSVYLLPGGTEFEHLRNAFPRFVPSRRSWR